MNRRSGCSLRVDSFDMTLGNVTWWRHQELLCLEPIKNAVALNELVVTLKTALQAQGLEIERRPFCPHLTLARDVRRATTTKAVSELRWQVDRIELVESTISSQGSVYRVLPTKPPT